MTPEEHKRAYFQGYAVMASWLAGLMRAGMTPEMAESHLAGAFAAGRVYASTYVSDRAAYELLQREADQVSVERAGVCP